MAPLTRPWLPTRLVNNPTTNGGVGAAVKTCPLATATFGGGSVGALQRGDTFRLCRLNLLPPATLPRR